MKQPGEQNVDMIRLLGRMNQYSSTSEGVTRVAYSKEEQSAKDDFKNVCQNLGMIVREDEAGNVIARREGSGKDLPAIAIGSHLDTVYNGGGYDGIVGVLAGVEVICQLNTQNQETIHPIEVIAFACEESARFHYSTIGSKAMSGNLTTEELFPLKDKDQISIRKAMKGVGLELNKIQRAERANSAIKAFIELHIEQGRRLEKEGEAIGIVSGIAAPHRISVHIKGKNAHSGTTEMGERQDALLAAAEVSLALEDLAKKEANHGTVATVGMLEVVDGAINVVPGEVSLKIDIRSIDVNSRERIVGKLSKVMEHVMDERDVSIIKDWEKKELPVPMTKQVRQKIIQICERTGTSFLQMISGAGHDAMNMAKRWPTALVFIPSVDGISHHPDEWTKEEDIYEGVRVLKETVLSLDR